MAENNVYTQLYERMFEEQERFREWLLAQPPSEILNHSYEYSMREDILMAIEYSELEEKHAKALLDGNVTLSDLYDDFSDLETDHMQDVRDTIGSRASKVLRETEKNRYEKV